MGYLDNTEITVDAILTKKGRQKLAQGQALNITKFALGDDEVDYSLYEPAHPKGSAYYDAAIRAIPVTEATPNESQALRYKLVTLPKGTTQIPIVSLGSITSLRTSQDGGATPLEPTTTPLNADRNRTAGYTLILADRNAGTLRVTTTAGNSSTPATTNGAEISRTAQVVTGRAFSFTPNSAITSTVETTLTVYGNATGGSYTIPVTVIYQP